ncbi:MAG: hypothetical protein K4571_01980 [Deltaproteobacteria bacterium]
MKIKIFLVGNNVPEKIKLTGRNSLVLFLLLLLPVSGLAQQAVPGNGRPLSQPVLSQSKNRVMPAEDEAAIKTSESTAAGNETAAPQPPAQRTAPRRVNQRPPSLTQPAGAQPIAPHSPVPPAGAPAQPSSAAIPAGAPDSEIQPPRSARGGFRPPMDRSGVSLNFDDADVYSVILTVFNEILRVNYIIDPRVTGRVTFRSIAPVPRDKVLPLMEVILRLNGVAVIEESGLYRIIPINDLSREPAAITIGRNADNVALHGKALLQVVPINYLSSSEVVKLLAPFASTNAVIVDIPKINHIIIVDTDVSVKRLLQLINIFDSEQQRKKGPQVFVHHIQNGKAKDISSILQQIFDTARPQTDTASTPRSSAAGKYDAQGSAAPQQPMRMSSPGGAETILSDKVKIFSDDILNAIVILGTPEDYEVIKSAINKLDIIPRQVLIEGAIAQISLVDKMSLGLAWSLKTNLFGLDTVNISLNPTSLNLDPKLANPDMSGLSLVGIDAGGSVRAVINALASLSRAKLLASPHILVSDNREARIQVGQQVPITTSETFGSVTVAPQRTIQYKDIGIILKVKPQINDSGLVTLDISQEVSTFSTLKLYANETQIILNKTEATTNLVVQDGQTVIIGGLIREDDSKARTGIPLLSKIPILGYLFGNTDKDNTRTELVILLTPHVIKTQKEAKAATDKQIGKMTDERIIQNLEKQLGVKAPGNEERGKWQDWLYP